MSTSGIPGILYDSLGICVTIGITLEHKELVIEVKKFILFVIIIMIKECKYLYEKYFRLFTRRS